MKCFCLIILCFFFSCTVRKEDLKDYMWKYDDGLHLGDVYYFVDENLKNDTLFIKSVPKYYIKTRKGYFGYPTELIIKNIETGEEGRYIGK